MKRIKKTVLYILTKLGYELHKIKAEKQFPAPDLMQDEKILALVQKNTMLSNIRLMNIKKAVEYIALNNIPGDFVECGVWKGGSVAFATKCLSELGKFPKFHLFDAFDDICEPDSNVDGERAVKEVGGLDFAKGRLQPVKGIYNRLITGGPGNEVEVLNLLNDAVKYPAEKIKIHKGYFQDVLPVDAKDINEISFLRLDGDWYASTKICLDYLYDKVVQGGVIIIDDYGTYEGCKKAVDEFLSARNIFPFKVHVDTDCIYWIKR